MTEETMNLKFKPPSKDTPGFLRRSKRALELAMQLKSFSDIKDIGDVSPEKLKIFDDMIEFLVPYVIEPSDPDEAREALWDASETQFDDMLSAVHGVNGNANPTTPGEDTPPRKTTKRGKRSASTSKA